MNCKKSNKRLSLIMKIINNYGKYTWLEFEDMIINKQI